MDAAEAWRRLAITVRAGRRQAMMSQAQLGAASGTSESTVRHLEGEVRQTFSPETLEAISRALGWTPDSAARILDGLEPIWIGSPDAYENSDLEARVSELERELSRVRAELAAQRNQLATVTKLPAPIPENWEDVVPDLDDEDEAEIWSKKTLSKREKKSAIYELRLIRLEAARERNGEPHRSAAGE